MATDKPNLGLQINNKIISFWICNERFKGIHEGQRYLLVINPNSSESTVELSVQNEFYFLVTNEELSDETWNSVDFTIKQKNNLSGVVDIEKNTDMDLRLKYVFSPNTLVISTPSKDSVGYVKLESETLH